MTHVQIDPVIVVSFAGPPKSAAPYTQDASIPEDQVKYFSSISELDAALEGDAGIPATDLQSMTVNDKVYAARLFLEGGGTFSV